MDKDTVSREQKKKLISNRVKRESKLKPLFGRPEEGAFGSEAPRLSNLRVWFPNKDEDWIRLKAFGDWMRLKALETHGRYVKISAATPEYGYGYALPILTFTRTRNRYRTSGGKSDPYPFLFPYTLM